MMQVIVLALAVWRCGSLLAHEEGPFDVFSRLRHLLGVRYDERSVPYGRNALARGGLCLWCNSVWFGALWVLAYWLWPDVTFWLALPLALSAGAILVEAVAGG